MPKLDLDAEEVNTLVWAIDHTTLDVDDYLEGAGHYADWPGEDEDEARKLRRALAILDRVRSRLQPEPFLAKLS